MVLSVLDEHSSCLLYKQLRTPVSGANMSVCQLCVGTVLCVHTFLRNQHDMFALLHPVIYRQGSSCSITGFNAELSD